MGGSSGESNILGVGKLRSLTLNRMYNFTTEGFIGLFISDISQLDLSNNNDDDDGNDGNHDDNNEKQKQQQQSQLEVIENIPPPPALRILDLSNCDPEAVNDIVVRLAVEASIILSSSSARQGTTTTTTGRGRGTGEGTGTGGGTGTGLVRVDLSQSVSITDASMELLAKYSYKTLESLNINFCPNISDYGLGYLVSKVNVQLKKLGIWGCAQISDVFLDGHDRIDFGNNGDDDDDGLEIEGAWMKHGGMRSIR